MPILMIDDNPFFVRHVKSMCSGPDAQPSDEWISTDSAKEGLALSVSARPSIILLDPNLHADESRLEAYCRQLAEAVLPASISLLLLQNPLQQFDGLSGRLADCTNLTIDSLTKPFEPSDLHAKLEHLRHSVAAASNSSMPAIPSAPQRFSWVSATPEVSGYAHIGADGGVLEWHGTSADEAGHGALMYLLRLASLCGEELGLGAVSEVQTMGREGSSLSVQQGAGAVLNVLGSPRANLRAISTRATEASA